MKVEPVAWLHREGENTMSEITKARQDQWIIDEHWADATPLYAIPLGYALVPVEPTREMLDAADKELMTPLSGMARGSGPSRVWEAMLTAAKGE